MDSDYLANACRLLKQVAKSDQSLIPLILSFHYHYPDVTPLSSALTASRTSIERRGVSVGKRYRRYQHSRIVVSVPLSPTPWLRVVNSQNELRITDIIEHPSLPPLTPLLYRIRTLAASANKIP